MRTSPLVAAAGLAASVSAATNYLGFNSGSTLADRSAKFKKDFLAEFKTAQGLDGAPGTFNAVRLYTNIQAYSESDPIEAFEAAIETKTSMLLGVWASGTDNIDKEITALKAAVDNLGDDFTDLVIGISIGSEDLYRNSATGVANKAGIGADPDVIVGFITDFKKAFANTKLSSVPIGHVDTWDVWPNATNKAVLDAIDWIGVDEYPYYENDKGNDIKNAGTLFDRAYDATIAAAGGKPVWVTETGWPYTGPDWDQAVASVDNSEYYWAEVGCRKLFNKVPTFWYNLRDSNPDNTMKFAITNNLSTSPRFNLTCPTTFDTPTTTSALPSSTGTGTGTAAAGSSSSTSSPSGTSGSGSATTTGSGSSASGTSSAASPDSTNAAGPAARISSSAAYAGLALVAGFFALF